MNDGHLDLKALGLIALIILGVVAGAYLLMGYIGAQQAQSDVAAKPANESAATAPPSNDSAPIMPAQPSAPPGQELQKTNKTLGALMDESLARADSRYYKGDVSGDIRIDTFSWYIGDPAQLPDSVPIKQDDLRAADVRFDGRYEDGLRAFVFRTYQVKDSAVPMEISATAIFLSNQTPLDSATPKKIYYGTHPQGAQIIEGCRILSKDKILVNASVLSIYDLACNVMYEAN